MLVLHKSLLGRCLILLIEQKDPHTLLWHSDLLNHQTIHFWYTIYNIVLQIQYTIIRYIITLIYKYKLQILDLKENADT